jgi:hypothetical protein
VRAVGPSGAADFEAVPGREEYGAGEDGAAEWEKITLEFAEDNFNDAGIEVRKTCCSLLSDSARGGMTRCYAGGLGSRPSGQHSA